jgi:hypothetical protein
MNKKMRVGAYRGGLKHAFALLFNRADETQA